MEPPTGTVLGRAITTSEQTMHDPFFKKSPSALARARAHSSDYADAATGAACVFGFVFGNGLKVIAIRNAPSPMAQEPT